MKKWLTTILLMFVMLASAGVTISAADIVNNGVDIEYFIGEDGVEHCWVRGGPKDEPRKEAPYGYMWILHSRETGEVDTRLGTCDVHSDESFCDIYCYSGKLEYHWKLILKEVIMVNCVNPEGYAMRGAQFILLKQEILKNDDGSYKLDETGKLQYKSSDTIGKGEVDIDGYAKVRLDEKRIKEKPEFLQLVLGQVLAEEQMDVYAAVNHRWYVNLKLENGIYSVYSVTEAPVVNVTDPEALKDTNFGIIGETSVSEYMNGVLYTKNQYRLGSIEIEIVINGFNGEIPSTVQPTISVRYPNGRTKRTKQNTTYNEVLMGEYTISYSNPPAVAGYEKTAPKVIIRCPRETEYPEEYTNNNINLLLKNGRGNAIVTVVYTYIPIHVCDYKLDSVIEPTCVNKGYTIYKCECGESYNSDYQEPYGHDYIEELIEPTCNVEGFKLITCSFCEYAERQDVVPKLGHDWKETPVYPTCEEQGYTTYTCERCSESYADDYVEPIGHDYKDMNGKLEPTCTEDGNWLQVCLNCSDVKVKEVYPATGHDGALISKQPHTCTEDGGLFKLCVVCREVYLETVNPDTGKKIDPAPGHKYRDQVIAPTTESEGYTIHTCTVCGDSYIDDRKDKLPAQQQPSNNQTPEDDSGDDDSGDDGSGAVGEATPPASTGTSGSASTGSLASINASDTLIVKALDELEKPLSGTVVALYDGQKQLRKWACTYDNVSILDNLEKYAKEGEDVSLKLVQESAPNGYAISKDSFQVQLSKRSGKIEISVEKNGTEGGSTVEKGKDGKPIVTFRNVKKTTQVLLTCEVAVGFSENCQVDEAVVTDYQKKKFDFTLTWTDINGEEQTEQASLSHGNVKLMEAKIPYGSKYELSGVDEKGNVITGLSDNASGTISLKQVQGNLQIDADLQYTVWADEPLELDMLVVDEATGKAIKGATFELRDPSGTKIGTYFSHRNGKIYIEDTFSETGDYLLTQTEAPKGYEPINGAAPVMVSLTCEPSTKNGAQILVQSMEAQIAHQAVSLDESGVYRIKNKTVESIETGSGKVSDKGSLVGAIAAIVGGLAAAGGGTAAILWRRKRKSGAL